MTFIDKYRAIMVGVLSHMKMSMAGIKQLKYISTFWPHSWGINASADVENWSAVEI